MWHHAGHRQAYVKIGQDEGEIKVIRCYSASNIGQREGHKLRVLQLEANHFAEVS
jgi:hypothetical protein